MYFTFDGKEWEVEYDVHNAATHDYDIWLINADDEQDTMEFLELPVDVQVDLQQLVDDQVWALDDQIEDDFLNDDDYQGCND